MNNAAPRNVIDNYNNGNLTDAKKLAKRVPWRMLFTTLRTEYNRSEHQATAIADYLKGKATFEQAVNAELQG